VRNAGRSGGVPTGVRRLIVPLAACMGMTALAGCRGGSATAPTGPSSTAPPGSTDAPDEDTHDRLVLEGSAQLDGFPLDAEYLGAVGPDAVPSCERDAPITFVVDGRRATPTLTNDGSLHRSFDLTLT
jgi:hypothetical protein